MLPDRDHPTALIPATDSLSARALRFVVVFTCSILLAVVGIVFFPLIFCSVLLGGALFVYQKFYGSRPESIQMSPLSPEVAEAVTRSTPPELQKNGNASSSLRGSNLAPPASIVNFAPTASDVTPSPPNTGGTKLPTQLSTGQVVEPNNTKAVSSNDVGQLSLQDASPRARIMAAALEAKSARLKKTAKAPAEILILYGSQTGNAMEIAKSINAEALSKGLKSKVFAMSDYAFDKLSSASVAIFVASSTGDGDPPENAEAMYNAIRKKSHPPTLLRNLLYTVLGLGDSNYTRFMSVPRAFSGRLPQLGASCFYKCCEADEVDGLEDVVDSWTAGLWDPLKAALQSASGRMPPAPSSATSMPGQGKDSRVEKENEAVEEVQLVGVPALQPCRVKASLGAKLSASVNLAEAKSLNGHQVAAPGLYTSANPFWAPVSSAKVMTADWSDRSVIHLELAIQGSGIELEAGDSIGVVPQNDPVLVKKLLRRLELDGDRQLSLEPLDGGGDILSHIQRPCSLRDALLNYVDLTAVAKKGLLRTLAEYCSDSGEQTRLLFLSSRSGKDAYKTEIQEGRPGLLDLLQEFPSCSPDLGHLLDCLPPLVARFYSVTNSPAQDPDHAQVAFSVVRMQTRKGRTFQGVCTSWLERALAMAPGNSRERGMEPLLKLPIFPKSGGDFHLPASLESPLLLIGPGTGVAPFRGFLQSRRAAISRKAPTDLLGEAWLFFGCRRQDEDFLYKEDLEDFAKDGTLTHLVTAFSRETSEKVYVQQKLQEHGASIAQLLLNPQGHIFICGDGGDMAKGVHAALLAILGQHADMKESLAIAHLSNMMTAKRYVRDIWS